MAQHILVIDDDKDITDIIYRILGGEGYLVTTVNSARDLTPVVAASNSDPEFFDLVLLDLYLPDSSGIELYGVLRDAPKTAYCPIVMLSAVSDISIQVKLLAMGVDDYIVKPFAVPELLTQVAIHLKLGQLRRDKQAAEARVALQTRQLRAINQISGRAAEHLDIGAMIREVARSVFHSFACEACLIYLYNPDTEKLVLAVSVPDDLVPTEDIPDIIAQVAHHHKSVRIATELAVPILRDDVVLGVLFIEGCPDSMVEDTLQSLEILAAQLTTTIINSYLFQDIQKRNQQLEVIAQENKRLLQIEQQQRQQAELLNEVSRIIGSSLDLERVLTAAMDSIRVIFQVEMGSIILHDKDAEELVFASSLDDSLALAHTRLPVGTGIVGQVIKQGTPAIINDAQNHPLFYVALDEILGQMTRTILCVPLIAHDAVIGAIQLINKRKALLLK